MKKRGQAGYIRKLLLGGIIIVFFILSGCGGNDGSGTGGAVGTAAAARPVQTNLGFTVDEFWDSFTDKHTLFSVLYAENLIDIPNFYPSVAQEGITLTGVNGPLDGTFRREIFTFAVPYIGTVWCRDTSRDIDVNRVLESEGAFEIYINEATNIIYLVRHFAEADSGILFSFDISALIMTLTDMNCFFTYYDDIDNTTGNDLLMLLSVETYSYYFEHRDRIEEQLRNRPGFVLSDFAVPAYRQFRGIDVAYIFSSPLNPSLQVFAAAPPGLFDVNFLLGIGVQAEELPLVSVPEAAVGQQPPDTPGAAAGQASVPSVEGGVPDDWVNARNLISIPPTWSYDDSRVDIQIFGDGADGRLILMFAGWLSPETDINWFLEDSLYAWEFQFVDGNRGVMMEKYESFFWINGEAFLSFWFGDDFNHFYDNSEIIVYIASTLRGSWN